MNKDYYKTLEISKNASDEEIKKAYRKLAHQYHPDKLGGDEKKFKEVNEAYQVLSNKEKRAQYDQFGRVFSAGGGSAYGGDGPFGGGSPFGQGGPFGGFDFRGFGEGFGFNFDPSNLDDFSGVSDIFDAFFEGLGVKKRKTYHRGADIEMLKEITLEDAFRGATDAINFETYVPCEKCGGQGHFAKEGFTKCKTCDGKGEVRENQQTFFGQFSRVRACVKCRGQGEIPNKICKECGSGRVHGRREVKVELTPGIADGQLIKIAGGGQAGERGAGAGDLYVRIKIKPHPVFSRANNDLLVKKELNLIDVLLGKKIEIPTISGKKINAEIPEGFNLRERFRIPGEGMPRFGNFGRGDLYVEFQTRTPKKASSKIKKLLEDLE